MAWIRAVVAPCSLTLTANSALALRYKALLARKAVLGHKVQPALRVPRGRKVHLAQLAHKAQPAILVLQVPKVQRELLVHRGKWVRQVQ